MKKKMFMRTTIGALILLVSGIVILSMAPKAPGQYQIGGNVIPVNPTAPGTKLFITMTIQYLPSGTLTPSGFQAGPFFMRIKNDKSYEYKGFSGDFLNYGAIDRDDYELQEEAFNDFFTVNVMPNLFPNNPSAPFAIKSSGQLSPGVEWDEGQHVADGTQFTMFDVVIAVKE